jgi:LacI family transcriptional regulator
MQARQKRLQNRRRSAVRAVDVARLARCSTATVSRVQNTPDLVSAETRERVLAAIQQLSYTPNSAARALRSERTGMIGIIIPTLNHAIYASLVEAAQRRLATEDYTLLVATFEYDLNKEAEQASMLIERGADGLILIGERHREDLYPSLEAVRVPFVTTYVFNPESAHPCIGIDNRQASFDIAEFLIGLGHRRFGVISAAVGDNDRAATRVDGIRAALQRHGLQLPPHSVVERSYSIPSGREGLQILRRQDPPPTAIICGNDVLAFGALIEARESGLAVPGDVSIVGFDNLDFTSHLVPPLTTMAVPAGEIGAAAAGFLLDALKGRPTPHRIKLETSLIARRSTGIAPSVEDDRRMKRA